VPAQFLTGVIEGYYGRQWSMETRRAYPDYLAALGLNSYIYAPKGDPWLRRDWHQPWPEARAAELAGLGDCYRSRGLQFGVGLSPFELYRSYGPTERELLREKVRETQGLGISLLSILFDDMPGELDCLAQRQAEIVTDVCQWVPGVRVQVCPTYYSFDPVLEKYFGSMPEAYWSCLGEALPPEVDIFWTGNKVCSDALTRQDVAAITAELGRPVMLWDNYPVNDGAVRSRRLYCEPLSQREAGLEEQLTGHLCNPMNQALLSLPALVGLARLYGGAAGEETVGKIIGHQVWSLLQNYQQLFRCEGLDGIGADRSEAIAREFDVLPGQAAREVAGWLRGEYTFDPACLTD
jgi:hyaluronoglucosaminidase